MIDERHARFRNNQSLIQEIIENHSNGEAEFRRRFGRGLRYLAERYCPVSGGACFEKTVRASLDAIGQGAVARDEDIAMLIRQELHIAVAQFPRDVPLRSHTPMIESSSTPDSISWLEMFTPLQRDVLKRFYLKRQDIATICSALPVNAEQINFIRLYARTALKPIIARTAIANKSAASADSSGTSRSAIAG
jgi:hypothetical protein